MAQTATTGSLENAQRTIIATVTYTQEHNAPAMALIEKMTLQKGSSTVTVPKVGQMSVSDLVDGQDIVDEEDIGMSTVSLTAAEVGAKVILTDKLVRQSQANVFQIIGRQLGEGMARKKDTDVHALYSGLNGGTVYGITNALLSMENVASGIAKAKGDKFGLDLYILHHPNSIYDLVNSAAVSPGSTYPIPDGFAADLLKKFWVGLRPINGVSIFEDGNLAIDSSNDATGVIASKDALVVLESVAQKTERQRDASLRATEVVMTSDYGVFELDDTRGAGWTANADAPVTNRTS
jgi:hypothetical protein